jgi:hypothetical protein
VPFDDYSRVINRDRPRAGRHRRPLSPGAPSLWSGSVVFVLGGVGRKVLIAA